MITFRLFVSSCLLFLFHITALAQETEIVPFTAGEDLKEVFRNPPDYARPRAFWWWLEGNISKAGILHDLKEMKKTGLRGAMIFDAGSSAYISVERTAAGPPFMSDEWQALFHEACRVADSLGLELSLNLGSGWNDGGPWITPEYASKTLVWSETDITGPCRYEQALPLPDRVWRDGQDNTPFFVPVAVLALRIDGVRAIPPLRAFDLKSVRSIRIPFTPNGLGCDWASLLKEDTASVADCHAAIKDIINLTDSVDPNGRLRWQVPPGRYTVLRFGYTATGMTVSTNSPGGGGLAIDYLSRAALDFHFEHIVPVLLKDLDPSIKSLRYLHDDSWELGATNWTPDFAVEFRKRTGYDMVPYLPILAGKILESREISNRFLYDFRRVIADLICDNHYEHFRSLARRHGLGLHPESGGPHPAPIDALKNLGRNDIPMGEFWARAQTHRVEPFRRLYIKQAASAAHIYGKRFVQAEGPTTIGPHWEKDPWDLKPTMDRVFCEGLNRLVIHTFTHSPASAGLPGNEYFAGTHLNPNITWWRQAPAFFDWVSRAQALLAQGRFVADVCYYYGDNTPNQVPLKHIRPELGEGYDYDVVNSEVILTRMRVEDGRLVLPDGMCYQVLVLPDRKAIPPAVLKKIRQLVHDGAWVIGPRPVTSTGLADYPASEQSVVEIAAEMWGRIDGRQVYRHRFGRGLVWWGKSVRQVLAEKKVQPDFSYEATNENGYIDYIHRRTDSGDIYFLANRMEQQEQLVCSFREQDKQPELWRPEDGATIPLTVYAKENGRIKVPLHLDPYGSLFILFRNPAPRSPVELVVKDQTILFPQVPTVGSSDGFFEELADGSYCLKEEGRYRFITASGRERLFEAGPAETMALSEDWSVHFDPRWGGPDSVAFAGLISWPDHAEAGIKYYSGTAAYKKTVRLEAAQISGKRAILELGQLHNLAEVWVNSRFVSVAWKKPFQADITDAIRAGENSILVNVVNLWPNRIIGDLQTPAGHRYTKTNVIKFNAHSPLLPSGLLGPVRLRFFPVMRPAQIENEQNPH